MSEKKKKDGCCSQVEGSTVDGPAKRCLVKYDTPMLVMESEDGTNGCNKKKQSQVRCRDACDARAHNDDRDERPDTSTRIWLTEDRNRHSGFNLAQGERTLRRRAARRAASQGMEERRENVEAVRVNHAVESTGCSEFARSTGSRTQGSTRTAAWDLSSERRPAFPMPG